MDFLKDFFSPHIIWLIIGIILLIIEFSLPGLIVFFFGIGAIVVGILSLIFDLSLNLQLIIFIITSVVLLMSLRKWLKKTFLGRVGTNNKSQEALDDFVGQQAVVINNIEPNKPGKIDFHGTEWTADSAENISKGTRVTIIAKHNITLSVKSL